MHLCLQLLRRGRTTTPTKRPDCPTCDGLSLIGHGLNDGYQPCPDCNAAGAVHSTPTTRTGDAA